SEVTTRRRLALLQTGALEPPKNPGPLKQRRFSEDYRRDSKHLAVTDRPVSLSALRVTLKIRGVKLLEGVVAV
ncbi:hypothetical protein TSAR_010275, partial [Trichomalopsis sarcophagae]